MPTVLVIDDETNILRSLHTALSRRGYDVLTAPNGVEGIRQLSPTVDAVLLDVQLPDFDGLKVLQKIKEKFPALGVLMISGHATIETAVKAVKLGAHDFLEKPLSLEKVRIVLDNLLKLRRLEDEVEIWRERAGEGGLLIGDAPAMKSLLSEISRAAPTDSRVLITGANGTGKEMVARMIYAGSKRKDREFLAVNCAAIPDELIESELFGHEKGSFTGATGKKTGKFQQAHRGTLFLDEIGDMSVRTQAKVLRVLEDGLVTPVGGAAPAKVDVRILAATNKDIPTEIKDGRFREDLFYRLNVIPIHLPPLVERKSDIPLLVEHFLQITADKLGRATKKINAGAVELLAAHDFPGNVRELRNIIERLVIMAEGKVITPADVRRWLPQVGAETDTRSLREAADDFEREYIRKTLDDCGGNVTRTAEQLGLERSHLYKKMKALGMKAGA